MFIYLGFRLKDEFLAMKGKRNGCLLQLSAPLLQLHRRRVSCRPCVPGQSHPPANRSGTSHRRARSLTSPIQSSLCPPRLQLRGLTLTRGCTPPVKHIKRSTVRKPLGSWPVKQVRCPAHPGVGAFLLTGPESFCMQLRNSPLYPILTSVCAQII